VNTSIKGAIYEKPCTAFEGKSPERCLQELIYREEIRELVARYAHRVAHGVSQADLFTEDAVFIARFPGRAVLEVRGREALNRQFGMGGTGNSDLPLPMIHNHSIEINGDEAVGICSNELRMSEQGKSMIGSGYYQDQYRREDGQWKFVVRDMTFMHWVPIQEGWAAAAGPR
jgi:hypothetical protein